MTQFKKFMWGSVAAGLAMVMAMSMIVSTAHAAATSNNVTTTVPVATSLGAGHFVTLPNIVLTAGAAADFPNGNLVLTAPAGYTFVDPDVAPNVAATATGGVTTGAPAVVAATITIALGGATGAVGDTITISNVKVTATSREATGGNITTAGVLGTPTAATLGTDTVATGWVSIAPISSIPATGATNTTVTALVGNGTGAGNSVQTSKQVTFTSSIAGFGTGGTSQVTVFSDATTGVATTTYRGTGTTGTDSITAQTPAPNSGVGSAQVSLTGAVAGTASSLTHVNNWATAGAGTASNNVAASSTAADPSYTSPRTGTNVVFRVTDAGNVGVNGQVLQISTDKGGLVAYDAACSTTAPKAITVTTAATFGGAAATTAPGRGAVRFCAGTGTANQGAATITATNISTTMATATATVTTAGVPATVTTNWTDGALEVTVTDAAGNLVADGTEVSITIASTVGSAAPATRLTSAGKATFAIALTGTTGTAIVSVNDEASGTNRLVKSVNVTTATPTTPPVTGDGSLTAPSFGTGNVGSAVFAGGTIEQLAVQVTAAGGTGVWVQDTTGTWRSYLVGGPGVVNTGFNTAFAAGFAGATAVIVVK